MGGRIERIIRAPVSRARRSPVGFRRKLPYESPVCSRRQRHGLGGSGGPRSPSRQLDISGLQLSRLESRVLSLYCCFARIRRTVVVGRASNQPGSVVTLSRHYFYSALPRSCQPITWATNLRCLGPQLLPLVHRDGPWISPFGFYLLRRFASRG